eukprot:14276802-Ditylum_brightwellii.AAC.1
MEGTLSIERKVQQVSLEDEVAAQESSNLCREHQVMTKKYVIEESQGPEEIPTSGHGVLTPQIQDVWQQCH